METSVEAAEVLVPPQPDEAAALDPETSEGETAGAPCADSLDPMEEFSQRLDDIIHTYDATAGLLNKQSVVQAEVDKVSDEAKDDITGPTETEVSLIMQSLDELSSPEEKLGAVVRRYAELVALRRCDVLKVDALEQKLSAVLEERQQLQAEHRSSIAARSKLETLCREQQSFYSVLREETLQRCKEDEEKRTEITTHFQSMLSEIQSQIELHSTRNEKLCHENINLTDKLENLMTQCERREESLEKINKHRDLQQKLIEAKLQQANALLAEAEEKHKREKEYLLREAIDKTKKCFAMKEQELAMKKKLTLYGQKFDEFQATLAKSNEIYVRFKKEMENMSDKMKKVEKESNLWKTRFENCNKALTDMIEERTERGKEYDLFVVKIQKLEKLCRALQDERKVLYDKIKEVRHSSANLPAKVFGSPELGDRPEGADRSALLTSDELKEVEEEDQVLTDGMARLKEEQAKLQEFAASLLVATIDNEEEENNELDLDEDLVSSAFSHFKTRPQAKEVLDSVPEQVNDFKPKEPDSEQPVKLDEVQVMAAVEAPESQETTSETSSSDPNGGVVKVQTQVETEEVQQVKAEAEIQQPRAPEPEPEQAKSEITPEAPVKDEQDRQQSTEPTPASGPEKAKAEPQTEPGKAALLQESGEGKPVVPLRDEKDQQQPVKSAPTPETEKSEDAEEMKGETLKETGEVEPAVSVEGEKAQKPTAEPDHAPEAASKTSESAAESSKKQLAKKKKKKSSTSAS